MMDAAKKLCVAEKTTLPQQEPKPEMSLPEQATLPLTSEGLPVVQVPEVSRLQYAKQIALDLGVGVAMFGALHYFWGSIPLTARLVVGLICHTVVVNKLKIVNTVRKTFQRANQQHTEIPFNLPSAAATTKSGNKRRGSASIAPLPDTTKQTIDEDIQADEVAGEEETKPRKTEHEEGEDDEQQQQQQEQEQEQEQEQQQEQPQSARSAETTNPNDEPTSEQQQRSNEPSRVADSSTQQQRKTQQDAPQEPEQKGELPQAQSEEKKSDDTIKNDAGGSVEPLCSQDAIEDTPRTKRQETGLEPAGRRPQLAELLQLGDESDFENHMRHFESRLASAAGFAERREQRSEQLKTLIDPGTFAKLLANKRKKASKKNRH